MSDMNASVPDPAQATPPVAAPPPAPQAAAPDPAQAYAPAAAAGTPTAGAPGQPAAPQYAAPAAPLSAESDKQAAMWAHIGGIVGFLPSLIIWLLFKDRGPRTAVEAKEALNWQITFTIVYVAIWVITTVLTGFVWILGLFLWLLPLAWWVLDVVWSIMGGMKVNAGGSYRYPINFRFIK